MEPKDESYALGAWGEALAEVSETEPVEQVTIGRIGNYYGCLEVCKINDRFFWTIEDHSCCTWEEIPEKLYLELLEFNSTNSKQEMYFEDEYEPETFLGRQLKEIQDD